MRPVVPTLPWAYARGKVLSGAILSMIKYPLAITELLIVVSEELLIARAGGLFESSTIEYRNFSPTIINEFP